MFAVFHENTEAPNMETCEGPWLLISSCGSSREARQNLYRPVRSTWMGTGAACDGPAKTSTETSEGTGAAWDGLDQAFWSGTEPMCALLRLLCCIESCNRVALGH